MCAGVHIERRAEYIEAGDWLAGHSAPVTTRRSRKRRRESKRQRRLLEITRSLAKRRGGMMRAGRLFALDWTRVRSPSWPIQSARRAHLRVIYLLLSGWRVYFRRGGRAMIVKFDVNLLPARGDRRRHGATRSCTYPAAEQRAARPSSVAASSRPGRDPRAPSGGFPRQPLEYSMRAVDEKCTRFPIRTGGGRACQLNSLHVVFGEG